MTLKKKTCKRGIRKHPGKTCHLYGDISSVEEKKKLTVNRSEFYCSVNVIKYNIYFNYIIYICILYIHSKFNLRNYNL